MNKKPKCTCPFNEETAREIGHKLDCPLVGEKTWWQNANCKRHDFASLPFIIRNEPVAGINREIAYVICEKCGQIRKQKLPNK